MKEIFGKWPAQGNEGCAQRGGETEYRMLIYGSGEDIEEREKRRLQVL